MGKGSGKLIEAAHLTENARAVLELSNAERIARIRSERWIGYTRAQQVLAKLEELLAHPPKHRMPNMLLVGVTNNGKTTIIERFHSRHPEHDNPEGDGITLPVLVVQAPPSPSEARFYTAILYKLHAPFKPSFSVDMKQAETISILRRINTRMLIIDEIHHILAGDTNKQRNFLNTIKYLGNELQIPIVGVGTPDAFNAINTDPQLANRFEPVVLQRWKENEEYLKLLASFERTLPLREPSGLVETKMALRLLSMSEGTIGELSTLLTRAAARAIEDGTERITRKVLDSLDWTQPSERKWGAKKIA